MLHSVTSWKGVDLDDPVTDVGDKDEEEGDWYGREGKEGEE